MAPCPKARFRHLDRRGPSRAARSQEKPEGLTFAAGPRRPTLSRTHDQRKNRSRDRPRGKTLDPFSVHEAGRVFGLPANLFSKSSARRRKRAASTQNA